MNQNDQILIDQMNARLRELALQHQPDHTPWIVCGVLTVVFTVAAWFLLTRKPRSRLP